MARILTGKHICENKSKIRNSVIFPRHALARFSLIETELDVAVFRAAIESEAMACIVQEEEGIYAVEMLQDVCDLMLKKIELCENIL